jgi:uncharacterized protein (UPF0262 family)
MTTDQDRHTLNAVTIDDSMTAGSREVEHERQVAIFDLLQENYFEPVTAPDGGPYALHLALSDGRLEFQITGPSLERRHLLSMTTFKSTIKDYFLICESYDQALRDASAAQIEAIDMGRRGIHNDGAERLRERLEGKVTVDMDTARRLFTLICALHRRS